MTTLSEDSKDTESDSDDIGRVVGPTVEPAVPVVEDDSWYQNILDFVHQEAEGDVNAPPNFARAHIPHNEVHASGPRRDASCADFAITTLMARG